MDLIVYGDQVRLCGVNKHDPWEILSFVWKKKPTYVAMEARLTVMNWKDFWSVL